MKKNLRLTSGILTAVLAVAVFLFMNRFDSEVKTNSVLIDTLEIPVMIPTNFEFGLATDSFEITKAKIKPNEFLANILLPHHIDYVTIDALAKKSKNIFDVRKMVAGKNYTILSSRDSSQKAQYFIYQPNSIDYIVYDLRDSISIYKGKKEVTIEEQVASGIINSSLYLTLQENKVSPALAVRLSEVFAWSIDFYRIQKGDWFKVIYEERFVEGESIGIGEIKAVEFNHYDKPFYAFHFNQGEKDDYFDEEANSLRKAFLKSPLKFSRLSSGFTMKRFHPVQKRWKAHLGTDYAAPRGTPIMSTGDGIVIESKKKRANGNYVKVKHNSVYTTQYLHMNKRNVKVGQHVKQGDIIGFVGSTGLATGPHVCYRFWKNGKQVNHLRQDFPSAEPVLEENKDEFELFLKEFKGKLDAISLEVVIADVLASKN
jgi:murein DD-endopeptidase MepM/ murein hydrolase activator NlpD